MSNPYENNMFKQK